MATAPGSSGSSGSSKTSGSSGSSGSSGTSGSSGSSGSSSSPGAKGRFTPKKGAKAKAEAVEEKRPGYQASGRYTAPTVHTAAELHETKPWVPYAMFAFLIIGLVLIIGNYLEILPGSSDGKYLLGGLLCITGGFATATQLR